ncbi:MAG: alpha/beta hydrolase [Planctomyces sp.]|nr:alpha/beta hydrolase [Planctomyces sp.]
MSHIDVGQENSAAIRLYYEDHGQGRPVVLIHGWPLSGASWEKQVPALLKAGRRVITYDRRGFGRSSQPSTGYEYDTFADDLHSLITQLDLRDVSLVGFSMGGGEVARYLGRHGADRIRSAVFMAAVPPYLLKTRDNPTGLEQKVFDEIKQAIVDDRPAFLSKFLADFYNVDDLLGDRISDEVVRLSWNVAAGASAIGSLACVDAWHTDFRADLKSISIPTLIIHGDSDRILPLEATGQAMQKQISGSRLAVIPGGPHGLNWTHWNEVNRELVEFLT